MEIGFCIFLSCAVIRLNFTSELIFKKKKGVWHFFYRILGKQFPSSLLFLMLVSLVSKCVMLNVLVTKKKHIMNAQFSIQYMDHYTSNECPMD